MEKQKPMCKNNDHYANNGKDITELCSSSISPEIFVIETSKDLPGNPVVFIGIDSVTALLTKNSIHFSQSLQRILFNK